MSTATVNGAVAPPEDIALYVRLTPRQRQVLDDIIRGLGMKEIASRWGVTPDTAESHRDGLYRKLGVHSRSEAFEFAARLGLIQYPTERPFLIESQTTSVVAKEKEPTCQPPPSK